MFYRFVVVVVVVVVVGCCCCCCYFALVYIAIDDYFGCFLCKF
jgi:hypothetical protein